MTLAASDINLNMDVEVDVDVDVDVGMAAPDPDPVVDFMPVAPAGGINLEGRDPDLRVLLLQVFEQARPV